MKNSQHPKLVFHGRAILCATRVLWLLFAVYEALGPAAFAQQPAASDVPPNAAAQIARITPDRATVGSSAKVEIEGSNFSAGAYVSCSTPSVRVVSTDRQGSTKLVANLEVNASAQPGAVTLYVSNPAGAAAESAFTLLAAEPPVTPVAPATTSKTPSVLEVSSVEPAKVEPGNQATLKIKGKGFADGVAASFSNPGVKVLATHFEKSSEFSVDILVAADAATGATSLFVVNPDDSEVEHAFEIGTAPPATGATTASTTTAKAKGAVSEQKFEVYNVGEAGSILRNPTQAKGTLILAGEKLRYEEDGKEVFSAAAPEIQEIGANVIFGINTGTFHVILKASKTYNFASATLRPADAQTIVDTLRRALRTN